MYNNPVPYMNVVHYMYTSLEVAFCIQSISFMLQGGSMSSLMSQKDIFTYSDMRMEFMFFFYHTGQFLDLQNICRHICKSILPNKLP